jgi:hypothetical protein
LYYHMVKIFWALSVCIYHIFCFVRTKRACNICRSL